MSSKPFTAKTFAWLRQINHSDRGRYLAVDLKVAVELTEYFREDDQDGRAYPSHKTLGDSIGRSERTVGRSLERMEANGDLRVIPGKPGRGCSGQYWMIIKPVQKTGTVMPVSEDHRKPASVTGKPASVTEKTGICDNKTGTATPENHCRTTKRTTEGTTKTLAPSALELDDADLFPSQPEAEAEEKQESGGRQESEASEAKQASQQAFERFWAIYPRRVAELAALKAWGKALKAATADQIIDGARRYAAERRDGNPQYTKHAATWLRGGCWMDEPGANTHPHEQSYMEIAEELRRKIEARSSGNGDPYGHPGNGHGPNGWADDQIFGTTPGTNGPYRNPPPNRRH